MKNSITVNGKTFENDELNPTGLVGLALEELEIDHCDKDFEQFLSDEMEAFRTLQELSILYPFIMTAHTEDHVLMIDDEWYLIPADEWDNCPYGKKETEENVKFWEKFLSDKLKQTVVIEYHD